jgi:hypothetical protein
MNLPAVRDRVSYNWFPIRTDVTLREAPAGGPSEGCAGPESTESRRLCAMFRGQLRGLLESHQGEWALIDDDGRVDVDVDRLALLNRHHPSNPRYFIIRRILAS